MRQSSDSLSDVLSQIDAGMLDGTYGVLAGLEVIRTLK